MVSPPPAEFSSTSVTPGGVSSRMASTFAPMRAIPRRVAEPPMRSDVGVHVARAEGRRALQLVDQPGA